MLSALERRPRQGTNDDRGERMIPVSPYSQIHCKSTFISSSPSSSSILPAAGRNSGMIPIRHKSCSLASLAGRTLPRDTCRAPQQYRFSSSPATPPADQEEHQIKPLTGSAKLFADAGAEEKITSNASNRDHLRMTQGPVWTGDESTTDAVLRMLVDAHKPLRDKGGVKHNAADEKIKGWMKGLQLEPRLSPGPSSPPEEAQEIALESVEKENPHRTKIPPHLHRPWHATYTGESRTAEAPKVKYGAFINKRTDGDSLTNLLELQLPPNADGKTRAKVKAARKSSMLVGRMDKAREGALDYKLGLGVDDTYMVETGEEGEEGQTFKGNRQIKGSSVLGAQRGSASGMKAWAGLVEDRILVRSLSASWVSKLTFAIFREQEVCIITMYLTDVLIIVTEAGFFKNASGKGKPIVADPEARNPHIGE